MKRKLGNPGKRALPELAAVVSLPRADGVPDEPVPFGEDGRRLWAQIWTAGSVWISPATDTAAVVEACQLADDAATARRRYSATTDPTDGRMVAMFSKRMSEALSSLGFDPTARTRLGVGEVKPASKLEAIRAKQQKAAGR